MSLKHAPVVIQLYPEEVSKADLVRELRINKHNLDRELLRQPGAYAWWAALYSETAAKANALRERLEHVESKLAIRLGRKLRIKNKYFRVSDLQHYIKRDPVYRKLKSRLRRWEDSERLLKYGVRAFEQRKDVLQSYCANQRREQDSEPRVRRKHHRGEGDDD
jgi:hypothetical protein